MTQNFVLIGQLKAFAGIRGPCPVLKIKRCGQRLFLRVYMGDGGYRGGGGGVGLVLPQIFIQLFQELLAK